MAVESVSWLLPAAKEAYLRRKELAGLWNSIITALFGGKTSIAFTGMANIGKTVLLDYRSQEAYRQGYGPPGRSVKKEQKTLYKRRKRLAVLVVPGQESFQRLAALNEVFSEKTCVDGIVHVVSSGFVGVREDDADKAIIRRERRTVESLRELRLKEELREWRQICQKVRAAQHAFRKPRWMIVAVTKADLFYDSIDEVQRYYAPHGESKFVDRMHELLGRVGTDNLQWTCAPVCGWLEDFAWNKQVIPSQFKKPERDHYLVQFGKLLESYCSG